MVTGFFYITGLLAGPMALMLCASDFGRPDAYYFTYPIMFFFMAASGLFTFGNLLMSGGDLWGWLVECL